MVVHPRSVEIPASPHPHFVRGHCKVHGTRDTPTRTRGASRPRRTQIRRKGGLHANRLFSRWTCCRCFGDSRHTLIRCHCRGAERIPKRSERVPARHAVGSCSACSTRPPPRRTSRIKSRTGYHRCAEHVTAAFAAVKQIARARTASAGRAHVACRAGGVNRAGHRDPANREEVVPKRGRGRGQPSR